VLVAGAIPATDIHGNWVVESDSTADGGSELHNPNANAAKVAPALASPSNYFETTFTADAGRAYHVWIRMQAEANSLSNDSVHLQFNDSVDSSGAAMAQIGTSASMEFVLQDGGSGPADHGWGWTENGWGAFGPHVFFATTGTHTLRIQQREDGAQIDQIVISPDTYLTTAPGPRRDDTTTLPANNGSGT